MEPVFVRAFQTKDPWEFVASTETVDRYGDVIVADGWDLRNFKKNPIALWQHSGSQPIGNWENIRIEEGKLMARLSMVKAGISNIADMVRGFVENRVLRAVSVGFRPLKYERIVDDKGDWTGGYRYTKSELMEISVVSIPANPEALGLAKSLGMSAQELDQLFAKDGDEAVERLVRHGLLTPNEARARLTQKTLPRLGPIARRPTKTSNDKDTRTMPTLAERITTKEADISAVQDQINELGASEDMTDEQLEQMEELTGTLTANQKSVETMKRAQAALLASARPAGGDRQRDSNNNNDDRNDDRNEDRQRDGNGNGNGRGNMHRSAPSYIHSRGKKHPVDLLIRAAVVVARSHVERKDPDSIVRNIYGANKELEVMVRAVTDPAQTSVAGWAKELVGETIGAFIDVLRPNSIFFNVPMPSFTFGRAKLRLPTRSGGTVNGDFVAEGAPIPVRRVTFGSVLMEPTKMGVITPFTREIAMLSDPAIEPLLRDMMTGDTRETIDTRFLDNVAAVPTLRPAGLQQLAGANTAVSSGSTLANIITDLKAAIQAMANNNLGTRLVWIMNTQRALSLSLVTNAAGNFMFRDEIAQGTLLGIPVLASTTVPSAIVFLMDAAQMAAAYDNTPLIDASEQATLHMESTAATVPPTPGTVAPIVDDAGDVAQPVRSLWQTASMALRLMWDINWNQRRNGTVYTITGVAW